MTLTDRVRHRIKVSVLTILGLYVAWLLFGWLALGPLGRWAAERYVADHGGYQLTMAKPRFNPFNLQLTIDDLHLKAPDGQLLVGFKELFINFQASSLFRWAWTYDTIRLSQPEGNLVLLPGGRTNWTPFIDAFSGKPSKTAQPAKTSLPRLLIHHFRLQDGQFDFADRTVQPTFKTVFKPLDLSLDDLSTLPDKTGDYRITARTLLGSKLLWTGHLSLRPVTVTGAFSLADAQLAQLEPYLKGRVGVARPAGRMGLSTDYRLTYDRQQLGLTLTDIALSVNGLKLRGPDETEPALAVDRFAVRKGLLDLASHRIEIGEISLDGGRVNLTREADGRFDVQHWLPETKPAAAPSGKPAPASPWRIQVAKVDLNKLGLRIQGHGIAQPVTAGIGAIRVEGASADLAAHKAAVNMVAVDQCQFAADRAADGSLPLLALLKSKTPAHHAAPESNGPGWQWSLAQANLNGCEIDASDLSLKPAAKVTLNDIDASATGLSQNLDAAVPIKLALNVQSGGKLELNGQVVPGKGRLDAKLDLSGLNLKPVQPYLGHYANLVLTSGSIDSSGRLQVGGGTDYRGHFRISRLMLKESKTGNRFLAWRSLSTNNLNLAPKALKIGQLNVDGLGAKLIIYKDKSTNIKAILKHAGKAQAAPTVKKAKKAKPGFRLAIDRVRIANGQMDYADESLALPFGTRIHALKGYIDGIDNGSGTPARIRLDGLVNKYGVANAAGRMDLLDPARFTDVEVRFKNVEMTRLTPYSATFAGRKIASGKLSLDLQYKIKNSQLEGNNKIVMDQLTLGARVVSPRAKDLPLDLAIAILQDANGRIDLGLPVSGNLNNPQFSYGQIVWKAITNLIGKIVLAPFRLLGKLFGGGEQLQQVLFAAGRPGLSPPEQEKLKHVAGILAKRPRLGLSVQSAWNPALDEPAIRELRVARALDGIMGHPPAAGEEPAPIDLDLPATHKALEKLYAKHFGEAALKTIKGRYEQANPPPPPTSAAGRLMARLGGLFRAKPKPLTPEEKAQLKGADLHKLLYQRLLAAEQVTEADLAALGKARAEAVLARLKADGVTAARLSAKPPAAISEAKDHEVPLKLGLEVAGH